MKSGSKIAFLFIGGAHQIFHAAPVAAEMACKEPGARIVMFCPDKQQCAMIADVMELYGATGVEIERLRLPRWIRRGLKLFGIRKYAKKPLLFFYRHLFEKFDAIIVPERTSACLRTFGVRHPKLIHFRHGAGDRAPTSEKRLSAFDLVVVPGEKDVRRAIDTGLVAPDRLAVSGYVKFDLVGRMRKRREPLFANGKPTVVYNPHFEAGLSSWHRHGRAVIEAFRAQDAFNLVVAPHIRLFENASDAERAGIEALAEPGRIIIDAGSARSIDMTYTLAADLYLGDVSSQVYEFIVRPRPCVFLNSKGVDWSQNPKYACWHLGEVVDDIGAVLPAVAEALADPLARAQTQRAALADAIGTEPRGAAARGAKAVLSYLDRKAA